eukprot:15470649-Alexandrium_andersonii.AAC.1
MGAAWMPGEPAELTTPRRLAAIICSPTCSAGRCGTPRPRGSRSGRRSHAGAGARAPSSTAGGVAA